MAIQGAPHPATSATQAANARFAKENEFRDRDREFAEAGFVATIERGQIHDDEGNVVWDMNPYQFLHGECPDTVNPCLWRHAQLNALHGLFRVTDGIYQVRAFDVSNMTLIETANGWIIIDPLTNRETAAAALALAREHVAKKPVVAVIYTHSHVDHWGGVKGVVSQSDVAAGNARIIAPEGFMEAAVSENVMAGTAMARRSGYQFGTFLPRGERGQVDAGMGKSMPTGSITLIPPTELIRETGETLTIDGLELVFQIAPETEAPAELTFFVPERRSLCMAELCTASLHNFLTLRGAQIRDSLSWSKYIDEALELWGSDSDSCFVQHNWPRFGNDEVKGYLAIQRDAYRYVHDQSLRLTNSGETMLEVGEAVDMDPTIASHFHVRGNYGSLNHNAKAVYQRYLGFFDGNPAHLHPHPPAEAGKRYVALLGGAEALLEKAEALFEEGDYRFVAELVNHLVFAEPENDAARDLQARALEQLGYQAESAIWRNFYLCGAYELREGVADLGFINQSSLTDVVSAIPIELLFDAIGTRVNGPRAAGKCIKINWSFSDTGERYLMRIENGTLGYVAGRQDEDADATLTLPRTVLDALATAPPGKIGSLLAETDLQIEGRGEVLGELFALIDPVHERFPIVTP